METGDGQGPHPKAIFEHLVTASRGHSVAPRRPGTTTGAPKMAIFRDFHLPESPAEVFS